MSIRSAIRAALASIARLVLVPVEIVVGGVRTVMSVLMPARNTSALDAAEEIVAEDTASKSLEALAAAREARRAAAMVRKSEPERVRQAARDLRTGRDVSRALFDPSVREEKEVADWLRTLDHLHLGHLANATDAEIEGHLAGEKRLPLPLLSADEKRAEEERESRRMPTELEWVQILITRRVENGDEPDGDAMDDLLRQARQLAESRARVGDHLPRRINADSRCGEDA